MKKKYLSLLLTIPLVLGALTGCANNTKEAGGSGEPAAAGDETAAPAGDTAAPETTALSHTYTTRFSEVNQITAPTFAFDYPEGWVIESETVEPTSEEVVLSNQNGVTITYWNFGAMRELTGPTREINDVTVTAVADAGFVPGVIQATDYSDLGDFMVARLETTGQYDAASGQEVEVLENGSVRYALLPKDQVGETQECIIPLLPTFSFWYGGHISLIARTTNADFTEQEVQEVVAILASFRDTAETASLTEGPQASAGALQSLDDLWDKLAGEWVLSDFSYRGKSTSFNAHTLVFQYQKGTPLLHRDYEGEQPLNADDVIYGFEAVNAAHYKLYVYQRGSYGNDDGHWTDEVAAAWWDVDISSLADGELTLTWTIDWEDEPLDNYNVFHYTLKK